MKKSTIGISLAIVGTTIVALWDNPKGDVETGAFQTVTDCAASGQFSQQDCQNSFDEARREHNTNAPAFKNKEDCEDEFGANRCQSTSPSHHVGSGFFSPYYMGYLIGRNARTTDGVYYPAVSSQPLYQSRRANGFVNGDGSFVTNKMGGFKMSPYADALSKPAIRTTTIARSGFGARSFAVS